MQTLTKSILSATIVVGAVALTGAGASAAVACSGNTCWHTHEHYRYPDRARIVIHEDNWRPRGHVVFREHEGRGYWRSGRWIEW